MDNIKLIDPENSVVDPFDEAPLFAGLEGFVLPKQPAQSAPATTPLPVPPKKTVTRKMKHSESLEAVPAPQKKLSPSPAPKSLPEALFLSVKDMCALLGISRATLVRMDKSNSIPGRVKLGGSVRYHRETVDAWVSTLITKK